MRERIRFIHEWEKGDLTMAGVCRKYGVSRPPIDERCWEVFFGPVLLGVVDSSNSKGGLLQPRRRWKVSTM